MTFDLERARGLRDFIQDDCAEVGDVWGEMIAEIERLRASRQEAESLTKKNATLIDGYLNCYLGRIEELESQIARLGRLAFMQDSMPVEKIIDHFTSWGNANYNTLQEKDARIKELEAQVINWTETSREYATNSDYWQDRARKAEGKIGNGDHVVGPDQMVPCWQITEERKAALKRLYGLLVIRYKYSYPDETETLRAMLTEAE